MSTIPLPEAVLTKISAKTTQMIETARSYGLKFVLMWTELYARMDTTLF